jgi:hypothetical protein
MPYYLKASAALIPCHNIEVVDKAELITNLDFAAGAFQQCHPRVYKDVFTASFTGKPRSKI